MARDNPTVIGFKDDGFLLWNLAKRLGTEPIVARDTSYPAGEIAVVGPAHVAKKMIVATNIGEEPGSLLRAIALAEGLRTSGAKRIELVAPWIAYGRQDRAAQPGEAPVGLAVAKTLATFFDRIITFDAHSPAFVKAFGRGLSNLQPLAEHLEATANTDVVAAPDLGAETRAKMIAKRAGLPFVQLEKQRKPMGMNVRLQKSADVEGKRVLLVDDIADSGSTLILAARALRDAGAKNVSAAVTHAVDLEMLKRKTAGLLESVSAVFDHATGAMEPWALDYLATSIR